MPTTKGYSVSRSAGGGTGINSGVYSYSGAVGGAAHCGRNGAYDHPDAVLTGVETRTSSPVRIPRDQDMESLNTRGLIPAGEGAGYAGGILSAGIDGIRAAEAVARQLIQTAPQSAA